MIENALSVKDAMLIVLRVFAILYMVSASSICIDDISCLGSFLRTSISLVRVVSYLGYS